MDPVSQINTDRLGKYIKTATASFLSARNWSEFISKQRGQREIPSAVSQLPHPAAPLLSRIGSTGVPVLLNTTPWTPAQKLVAITRGSHQSAKLHMDFLREEMADMVDQQFWVVIPYDLVANHPNLRLSPMGVVPQRDRRDRPIVDYSFSGINGETVSLSPAEAMQFGRALDRLLYKIHHSNRRFGPVYLIKVDLSDGFYRIRLTDTHLPFLAVAFPNLPHEPRLVALPLVLPMGWVASPPYFCALTETAADLANGYIASHRPCSPHPLSIPADHPTAAQPLPSPVARPCSLGPQPVAIPASMPVALPVGPMPQLHPLPVPATMPASLPPFQPTRPSHPLSYVDVYMDDFLGLAQGHPGRRSYVRSTLLHAIDQVLRPLSPTDSPHRKQPISLNKLNKGDAQWATRKLMLGWVLDTVRETIELPPHRIERLHSILSSLRARRRISLKQWQQQLGELRSMVLALPGGRGLFSTLYTGLTQPLAAQQNRVRLSAPIHDAISDLQHLANDLATRPTRLGEIVDSLPAAYGAADASGSGMGGVWLSDDPSFTPTLWRAPFPDGVSSQLVSFSNPRGSISNSDLELAAQIASQDIIIHLRDCRERSVATFTDNISARSWQTKGSRATLGPAAYLLRLLSLHQRHYRYRSTSDYIPGPVNAMADDASRLLHLSDTALLAHFNTFYPQTRPWRFSLLRPAMLSALITALHCKRSVPASFLSEHNPETPTGFDGSIIATRWTCRQRSNRILTQLPPYKFSPSDIVPDTTRPATTLSDLAQWKRPSGPSGRRFPAWGPRTLV